MKIAITSTGSALEDDVDPRFGRCQYFIIADPDTFEFQAVENSSAVSAGGAGVASGQMIAEKGVNAVLTGNCGPNAYQVLSAAGIQVITGVSGKVRDAIEMYKAGKYKKTTGPTVSAHSGMGMGYRGTSKVKTNMEKSGQAGIMEADEPLSSEQEMKYLKSQADELTKMIGEIKKRIEKLEKNRDNEK